MGELMDCRLLAIGKQSDLLPCEVFLHADREAPAASLHVTAHPQEYQVAASDAGLLCVHQLVQLK